MCVTLKISNRNGRNVYLKGKYQKFLELRLNQSKEMKINEYYYLFYETDNYSFDVPISEG